MRVKDAWQKPSVEPFPCVQQAEDEVLAFLQRHTDASTGHHLAGSSVHVCIKQSKIDLKSV